MPPNQSFVDELVIGVWAGANHNGSMFDNLGLEKVIVHCEGASYDIAAPSFNLFADANGELVRYLGWWGVLKHSGLSGDVQVYFEAVPKDPTMQNRVLGPFLFSASPTEHDFDLEIAPTPAEVPGVRYKTFLAAFNYLRTQSAQRPRITVVESGEYDLGGMNVTYAGTNHCLIESNVPITIKKPGFAIGNASRLLRTRYDGLWFRGNNITFDFLHADSIYHESAANPPHVFDGVRFTDSGGNYYTYLLGPKTTFQIARNGAFFLECAIDTIQAACNNAGLVRGCLLEGGSNDSAQAALCVVGSTIRNWSSDQWREEIPALTVHYQGTQSAASLSLSGANSTNQRELTAKVGNAVVGSFVIDNSEAGFAAGTNYTVQNVVDWINSLPDWNATLLDNTRYAAGLSKPENQGAAFTDLDVKTAKTLITTFDLHPDIWQHVGTVENRIFAFNNCYNNVVQSIFLNTPCNDLMILSSTFHQDEGSPDTEILLSQLITSHSHVVVAHNSSANQALHLRTDFAYAPDQYCLVANNVFSDMVWTGAPNASLAIRDNHLMAGAIAPAGAVGTTIGGTANSIFVNAGAGQFLQQGELLAISKPPVLRYDMSGVARPVPALLGALVGPDAVAPEILSANPSGSYAENLPVGGAAFANKAVTWSVIGPDSSAITIDSGTGVWSLEATDFERKLAYTFSFLATDNIGNTAEQSVLISIADVDETAPAISNPSATANGTSGANLSIDTDEGNGTLYWYVTTSAAAPSVASLIAGIGAAAGGSLTVNAAGNYSASVSGLSPATTYFTYFVHRDLAGNMSPVLSASNFTTEALSGGNIVIQQSTAVLQSTDQLTTYSGTPFGYVGGPDKLLAVVVVLSQSTSQTIQNLSVSVNGFPMTRISGAAHTGGVSRPICGVFVASGLPSGQQTIAANISGGGRSCTILALEIVGANLSNVLANTAFLEGNSLNYSHNYTPSAAGNLVISTLSTRQGARGPFTPDAGVIELMDASTGSSGTSDHSVFIGHTTPSSTSAIDVGATTSISADVLFVVTEIRKA